MIIEEALFFHLTVDPDVSALVGTRVYPLVAPQDADLPLLVYQRISTPRVRSHSGPSGLAYPRFQITARATSVSQLRDLANKVRIALDGFKGVMGGGSGVNVGASFQENERDVYGETTKEYSVQMDFTIWHREATA